MDPDFVTERLIELEDYRSEIILEANGLEKTLNETWGVCEEKVQSIIKEELGITAEIELDRCHCTGELIKNQSKPGTIVCRFLKFKDKEKILGNSKKLKDTGIFIYESFCKETVELLKSL